MTPANRALFVSAYPPDENVPKAGSKIAAAKLKDIAAAHAWVDVVTFLDPDEDVFFRALPANLEVHAFATTRCARLMAALRYPFLPFGASVRQHLAGRAVRRLLAVHAYDHVYVDFSQAAAVLPRRLMRRASLRVHDVMSTLYARHFAHASARRKPLYLLERLRSGWFERTHYPAFGTLICLTEKDATLIADLTGARARAEEVQSHYRITTRSDKTVAAGAILLFANFSRPENSEGALWFLDQVFPAIRLAVPGAHVYLVGAGADVRLLSRQAAGITGTGFVEDPTRYFEVAQLAVAPLMVGAGVKIKVLEYLAAGIPTVATTVGAEGIAQNALLEVHDDGHGFSLACVARLVQPCI